MPVAKSDREFGRSKGDVTGSANPEISGMFDRISRTYDFLNHLLSLGTDRRWRNLAIRKLSLKPEMLLLDCSAGTGDMAFTALRQQPGVQVILMDPAAAMLAEADAKAVAVPRCSYRLVRGAAERLPFADRQFDRFMVAFGIRNFADLGGGMRELSRTLKPGGVGVIIEFTPERARLVDRVFRWYMRHVMVKVGGWISGDRQAYSYLFQTVEHFPSSSELVALFGNTGLRTREVRRLSSGIARLFVLEKV
jgi:demethylmenaquinone methyltransferase / 2-methoxy-6-polyprenyl-1,4-benzoquinol methylase